MFAAKARAVIRGFERERRPIDDGGFQIKALLLPAWPDLAPETTDHKPAEERSKISARA